jgi:hypothetical protein
MLYERRILENHDFRKKDSDIGAIFDPASLFDN